MEDVLFPLHTVSPVPRRSEGDIIRIMLGKNIGGKKKDVILIKLNDKKRERRKIIMKTRCQKNPLTFFSSEHCAPH